MLVGGIAYPLLTTGVAQALFPHAANGSLIERNGQTVGSALIGQQFDGARYFHGRPSATTAPDPAKEGASIAAPYNAGLSGASNQGATHKDLADTVAQRVAQYRADNGLAPDAAVPVDAVTASASGLCLASVRSCRTRGGKRRSGALPVLMAWTSTRLAGWSA